MRHRAAAPTIRPTPCWDSSAERCAGRTGRRGRRTGRAILPYQRFRGPRRCPARRPCRGLSRVRSRGRLALGRVHAACLRDLPTRVRGPRTRLRLVFPHARNLGAMPLPVSIALLRADSGFCPRLLLAALHELGVARVICDCVEGFYNRSRIQSALGFTGLLDYESYLAS